MFGHAPPHTYSPDYADFLNWVWGWLFSSGNVLTDVILQVLGILITVGVIQRYIDRLEERRWAPARDRAYYRLCYLTLGLMGNVPYHRRAVLSGATYKFGVQPTIGAIDYGKDFEQTVWEIDKREFEPAVEHLSSSPDRIVKFRQMVDRLSEPEIAVFMNREPELGMAIGVLRERISQAAFALERYRNAASPDPPSRGTREYFNVEGAMKEAMDRASDRAAERNVEDANAEAMEQACIALRMVVLATYKLHRWLVDRASSVERRKP